MLCTIGHTDSATQCPYRTQTHRFLIIIAHSLEAVAPMDITMLIIALFCTLPPFVLACCHT
jgi:hypothetical protein